MSISFNLPANVFLKQYQEKKPLLMKGAIPSNNFSWRDANEIFERSNVASNDFKLSYGGIRPKHEYVESYWDIGTLRHRLITPVVYDYLRKGATLIANKIANEPKVNQFSKQISHFTGRQVVSSAYVAFGVEDSFRAHWDTRDVFAIQLIGRKRWIVYEPSFESPLYMQQSKDYEDQYPCPKEPYMDFILEAGDVFYLPRGWWHNPLPLGEETFHLAIGTFPAYAMDYVSWIFGKLPSLLDARRSLHAWESDEKLISSLAGHIGQLIGDSENYQRFMDEFVAATRVESRLAIEAFGILGKNSIPDTAKVRLNATRLDRLSNNYLIANGTKLNLDETGLRLIRCIANAPTITLSDLVSALADIDTDKVRKLVYGLCHQNILELIND